MSFRYQILDETRHRPWPMPAGPWVMTQTWHDLLFAHWPIDASVLRAHVPSELPIDVYEGQAWIGVIPFHMTNVAPRAVTLPPLVSAFPELNVRTYVTVGGRPGVFFFSLDAASALAVGAARALLGLPYFVASMVVSSEGGTIDYVSRRGRPDRAAAVFDATYRATGPALPPLPGSLEHFLTERYCLYTVSSSRRVRRLEIHHPPWPLQPAEAEIRANTMAAAAGITLPAVPPLLHFAGRQDMVAWVPRGVGGGS